jgi:hypothetical protein
MLLLARMVLLLLAAWLFATECYFFTAQLHMTAEHDEGKDVVAAF